MFEFNGNEYWDLNETSQRLEISKKKVLKRFAREALIRYKDDAVCENILIKDGEYEGEFEDYKDIKWVDGMFWLPAEAYPLLEKLFDDQEGLTHVLVQRLTPQNLIGQSLPPCKLRSLCASFDWLVVSDVMLAEIPIDKNTPIYFLVDTVKKFVTKKEPNQSIVPNTGPISTTDEWLDIPDIAKELPKLLGEEVSEKKVYIGWEKKAFEIAKEIYTSRPKLTGLPLAKAIYSQMETEFNKCTKQRERMQYTKRGGKALPSITTIKRQIIPGYRIKLGNPQ